jgi:hypothetical protein
MLQVKFNYEDRIEKNTHKHSLKIDTSSHGNITQIDLLRSLPYLQFLLTTQKI